MQREETSEWNIILYFKPRVCVNPYRSNTLNKTILTITIQQEKMLIIPSNNPSSTEYHFNQTISDTLHAPWDQWTTLSHVYILCQLLPNVNNLHLKSFPKIPFHMLVNLLGCLVESVKLKICGSEVRISEQVRIFLLKSEIGNLYFHLSIWLKQIKTKLVCRSVYCI